MNVKELFEGKKITVMGLGLLGRGIGDAEFLAENGAELIVTDLKTEEQLGDSLARLESFVKSKDLKPIAYRLGSHDLADFQNRDFILKAGGVPLDSIYIDEAKKNKIPIKMSESWFAEIAPVNIIGVTGTRGKSTVTQLIYHILASPRTVLGDKKVFLGGNVRGVSTLSLLREANEGDIAVMELDSWRLQGFGESGISPHIAIFTNLLKDHLNYYGGSMDKYWSDKANIFRSQKPGDFTIAGKEIAEKIETAGTKIVPEPLPADWPCRLLGEHNRINAGLAAKAAELIGIDEETIKNAIAAFTGVPGRLEFLKEVAGVKIYNDTTATTPDATLAGLKALGKARNIVLILGGADKNLDMSKLAEALPLYCKKIILLPGTGTEKLDTGHYSLDTISVSNLQEAVGKAREIAAAGDIILLSPAFASFGLFKNEFDRGEQFEQLVKKL